MKINFFLKNQVYIKYCTLITPPPPLKLNTAIEPTTISCNESPLVTSQAYYLAKYCCLIKNTLQPEKEL